MKKFLIPLVALLMSIPLTAQDKFEVRIGWGGYPLVDAGNFVPGSLHYCPSYTDPGDLEGMYAPQNGAVHMTGQIYGEFSWHVRKKLTLAGGLYFNGIYGSIIDPDNLETIRKTRGVTATILPTAYWYWANRPKCRFYSGIGLGVNMGTYEGKSQVSPALQLTAIGFTVGKKVFFFAEYGVGTLCMGGKAGLGYRF